MDEITQENKDFLIKIGQVIPEAKASTPAAKKVEE